MKDSDVKERKKPEKDVREEEEKPNPPPTPKPLPKNPCVMDQPPFLPAQRRRLDLRRRLLPRVYNQFAHAQGVTVSAMSV